MRTDSPPYWHGPFDRWNALVAVLLALTALVLSLQGGGAPQPAVTPATPGPAAGVTPEAGQPFELTGTAAPGATVKVYEGDKLLGETTAGSDGSWTMTVPGLPAGTHELVARSYDAAGKELAAQPFSVTVPAAGAAATPGPAAGVTPEAGQPFELTGTAAPGATVKVYEGDKLLGETTAGSDGTWTMTVPGLPAGTHDLVARSYDAAGKELAAQPFSVTVPAAGAAATPGPAAGVTPEAGQPFELTGTAAPGATVKVYEGETLLGETTAGPDGRWTMTVPGLPAGTHDLVARSYDAAGKELAAQPFSVTVPAAGAAATPGPAAGVTPEAGQPFELTGTAAPGATVKVYEGEKLLGETTAGSDGTWTMTVPGLPAGTHELVARSYDAAGKELAAEPFSVTVPAAGAAATPGPAAGVTPEAGQPFELTGTAAPGATVKVYEGETLLGETTAGSDGTWTMTVPGLPAGTHELVARSYDAAGKELAAQPFSVTVPAAGAAATPGPAAGATPEAGQPFELTGTAAPGATVKVYEGDKLLGETTAGSDGTWTMTVPGLAAGTHELVARLYGAAGKELAAQPFSVTVPAAGAAATPGPAAGAVRLRRVSRTS